MENKDCKVVRELPGYVYVDVTGPGTCEACAAWIERQRDMRKRNWRQLTIMNIETGRLMSHVVR